VPRPGGTFKSRGERTWFDVGNWFAGWVDLIDIGGEEEICTSCLGELLVARKGARVSRDISGVRKLSWVNKDGELIKELEERYANANLGEVPSSLCYDNTKFSQLWWANQQVDYKDIGSQLGIDVITISSIKQLPGCIIPLHNDTFYQMKQRYPERIEPKVRANIYLEDWKTGHYIQYNDNVSTHWKSGQGIMWDSEVFHLGANAGISPKYTLQVSGFLVDNSVN